MKVRKLRWRNDNFRTHATATQVGVAQHELGRGLCPAENRSTLLLLLSATGPFVHCGPSSFLGGLLFGAALFVAFLDMRGLPLLFAGVTGFISSGHNDEYHSS